MSLQPTPKTIEYGQEVCPKVGSHVKLDGKTFGENLLPGDDYIDDGFPGCQFRYPNPVSGWGKSHAIACNVEITGRKFRYWMGGRWVRIKIEWVGDCEPSTFTGGWMAV